MEISFKGTLAEFQTVFRGMSDAGAFIPSDLEELVTADEIRIEHPAPLTEVPSLEPSQSEALSFPQNDLPKLSRQTREEAWEHFTQFCTTWVQGFGDLNAPQPDRLALMTALGQGRWPIPILVMAYEIQSLQRLVQKALVETGHEKALDLDWIDLVASNMVQVSHIGFPDISGTYDYSTRWRR